MKFAKLSIAAIMVVGFSSSAVAGNLDDATFSPFAKTKIYYETVSKTFNDNAGTDTDLFASSGASGGAMVSAGATGKLTNCFGYGFEYMAVDTLGLENNLVTNTRMGSGIDGTSGARAAGGILDTQHWAPQAYITYSPCDTFLSNTTFKIGRQYLDTPLAFTENWNIAPNSFDAAVVVNKDIINTTLIGAYVGRGNGVFGGVTNGDDFRGYGNSADATGDLTKLGKSGGAYAIGAITSLFDGAVPLSIWGYDVVNIANAVWADAGYKLNLGDTKLNVGAQYGMLMADDDANSLLGAGAEDIGGFGVKAGTSIKVADMNFGLMAAYSQVDEEDVVGRGLSLANTATGFKKTKLYTAGIYNDGVIVAHPGSKAFKVKGSTKIAGIGSLAVQYINNTNDKVASKEVSEIDVILGTTLPGGLGAKFIYMNRDFDTDTSTDFDHVRIILSKNF